MSNPYKALERETYRLVRGDETLHLDLRSQGVKSSIVKFYRQDVDFTVGDVLKRDLPHGKTENWRIDGVEFKSPFHAIPAHYVLTVSNAANPKAVPAPRSVTNNLYGANSRVNNHSIDRSHNTVQIDSADLLTKVEAALAQAVTSQQELQDLQHQLAQMRATRGQPGFVQRYVDFISMAADHLTVLTPFLPALAQLLVAAREAH